MPPDDGGGGPLFHRGCGLAVFHDFVLTGAKLYGHTQREEIMLMEWMPFTVAVIALVTTLLMGVG